MVITEKMQKTVNEQPREFTVKGGSIILCLPFGLRKTYDYITQKQEVWRTGGPEDWSLEDWRAGRPEDWPLTL